MAKQPAKGSPDEPGESPKPISYRPARDVAKALKQYMARFKVKPKKAAVIDRALREFFRNEGIDIAIESAGGEEE